jgi:hypothetical protein
MNAVRFDAGAVLVEVKAAGISSASDDSQGCVLISERCESPRAGDDFRVAAAI